MTRHLTLPQKAEIAAKYWDGLDYKMPVFGLVNLPEHGQASFISTNIDIFVGIYDMEFLLSYSWGRNHILERIEGHYVRQTPKVLHLSENDLAAAKKSIVIRHFTSMEEKLAYLQGLDDSHISYYQYHQSVPKFLLNASND
jgi:hypothetical protein